MEAELELISIMEHLTDEELKKFKWHLKLEKVDDIEPIKASQLSKADREETVDLMCQKYEATGAVGVMRSILTKINRNDLLAKLSKKLGAADPSPAAIPRRVPIADAEKKLVSIRAKFVEKVSDPGLRNLMDKLLEQKVITEAEMEAISEKSNRGEKARGLIDTVKKKGGEASSVLITALCDEDQYLAKELGLM